MTGMQNECLKMRCTSIYQSIEKGCFNCNSQRPCPPLILIAMRYAEQIAKRSVSAR